MILGAVSKEDYCCWSARDPLKFVQIGSSWATEWSLRHAKNPLFKVVYLGLPHQPKKVPTPPIPSGVISFEWTALSFYPQAKKWVLKETLLLWKICSQKKSQVRWNCGQKFSNSLVHFIKEPVDNIWQFLLHFKIRTSFKTLFFKLIHFRLVLIQFWRQFDSDLTLNWLILTPNWIILTQILIDNFCVLWLIKIKSFPVDGSAIS